MSTVNTGTAAVGTLWNNADNRMVEVARNPENKEAGQQNADLLRASSDLNIAKGVKEGLEKSYTTK
jgi:hypothetical protein